jgi:predicted dehydrogenase
MSIHAESDIDPEAGVDRMIALQILFSGGQLAQSVSAFGLQYKSSYEVTGTTGRLNVERAYAVDPQRPTKLTLTSGQDASQVFQIPAADQFRLAIDDFAASVARGTGAPDYEGDLLRVHAVMDAARRSLELRETVSLRAVA